MSGEKLVRDKIPEIIAETGATPIYHTAVGDDIRVSAVNKVLEESQEVASANNRTDVVAELADLQEAIMHLQNIEGITFDEVESARVKKIEQRGGFDLNIILDKVEE